MEPKQLAAYLLVAVLLVNLVFFALGFITSNIFWGGIIGTGLISYFFLQEKEVIIHSANYRLAFAWMLDMQG